MNYLTTYQTFINKYELNEAVAIHLENHGGQLNATEKLVLTTLSQYAVKYPGVAHLKLMTIGKIIGKAERTVRRAIEKLERLQIIERKTFLRGRGGQGANIFVILPTSTAIELRKEVGTVKATNVTVEPQQEVGTQATQELIDQYAYIPVTHYEKFTSLVQAYFGDNQERLVQKLYGVYKAQSIKLMKFSIHADKKELFERLAMQAVTILCQATKKKTITNLVGYYDGILRELIDQHVFADAFMDYAEPVEFFIPESAQQYW